MFQGFPFQLSVLPNDIISILGGSEHPFPVSSLKSIWYLLVFIGVEVGSTYDFAEKERRESIIATGFVH